ncbi:hypothetical protein HanPI659440_Chr17g0683491 [Helianthus annuus]|nr:hypothetical protein HanPI659440_Chr17g0683491 [Helianthus annuus]
MAKYIRFGLGNEVTAIQVTSLKIGDQVLLKLQGGATHTGVDSRAHHREMN